MSPLVQTRGYSPEFGARREPVNIRFGGHINFNGERDEKTNIRFQRCVSADPGVLWPWVLGSCTVRSLAEELEENPPSRRKRNREQSSQDLPVLTHRLFGPAPRKCQGKYPRNTLSNCRTHVPAGCFRKRRTTYGATFPRAGQRPPARSQALLGIIGRVFPGPAWFPRKAAACIQAASLRLLDVGAELIQGNDSTLLAQTTSTMGVPISSSRGQPAKSNFADHA